MKTGDCVACLVEMGTIVKILWRTRNKNSAFRSRMVAGVGAGPEFEAQVKLRGPSGASTTLLLIVSLSFWSAGHIAYCITHQVTPNNTELAARRTTFHWVVSFKILLDFTFGTTESVYRFLMKVYRAVLDKRGLKGFFR